MWEIACGRADGIVLRHENRSSWPLGWICSFSVCPAAKGPASDFSSPRGKSLAFEPEPAGGAIKWSEITVDSCPPSLSNYATTSQNARAPLGLTHFKFISNWLGVFQLIRAGCSVWPKSLQLSLSSTKREKLFAPERETASGRGACSSTLPATSPTFLRSE